MLSCVFSLLPVIEYLLTLEGRYATDARYQGDTTLTYAVKQGNYEVAAVLLKDGRCDPAIISVSSHEFD